MHAEGGDRPNPAEEQHLPRHPRRLMGFEIAGAEVYYVAPRFSNWAAYELAFQAGNVLENSLMVTPSEILRGAAGVSGVHRVVYDRVARYVCSEPISIREETPASFAERVGKRARNSEQSLEAQVVKIAQRAEQEEPATRLSSLRRSAIMKRAKRPIDGLAVIIGLEAWSQGAQTLFVTTTDTSAGA